MTGKTLRELETSDTSRKLQSPEQLCREMGASMGGEWIQLVAKVRDSRISGMGSCKIVVNALIAKMHTWLWSRAGDEETGGKGQ